MAEYKTVPVDLETHQMIMALCKAYEMGKRAQGAIVRRLVKAEFEKQGLELDQQDHIETPQQDVVS